jgi:hypothetical protein
MAYTKYSLTPADNNAAPPNGAPEGMLPSGVNDTMRDMMAQIRDVGDGIRGGTYTMTAPVITGGSITGVALTGNTFTSPVISGGSINNTPIGATTANTGAFSTLSATGVTTVQTGSVSAPAITTTGDTNTGIYFPAADTIGLTVGGVESARVVSGLLSIPANSTAPSAVRLYEDTDNGTNYVDLIAPAAITSNRTLTIPDETGTIITTASSGQSIPSAALPAGSVLQVVNAQFDDPSQFTTTSTSAVSTTLTLSITPKFATSKILVFSNTQIINQASGVNGGMAIYRNGSTSLGWNSWFYGSASANWVPATNISYDSPATTSATTYTLYIKSGGGTISVFWGSGSSSTITAMEIAA